MLSPHAAELRLGADANFLPHLAALTLALNRRSICESQIPTTTFITFAYDLAQSLAPINKESASASWGIIVAAPRKIFEHCLLSLLIDQTFVSGLGSTIGRLAATSVRPRLRRVSAEEGSRLRSEGLALSYVEVNVGC